MHATLEDEEPDCERLAPCRATSRRGSSAAVHPVYQDFPAIPINKLWDDTAYRQFQRAKAVRRPDSTKMIERCILMTTDPGDSFSTRPAAVGRRPMWPSSGAALDHDRHQPRRSRHRPTALMTAKFRLLPQSATRTGAVGGLQLQDRPHITLKSIAQNPNLDPIFARHEPILDAKLADLQRRPRTSHAEDLRRRLAGKLLDKERAEGKRAVTDADRRRWELPKRDAWEHWSVPFDTDPDWPKACASAVTEYRKAWRAKMDEVNACIAANAEQEELVDQPEVVKGIVRVSGPFTVEAVQPAETSLGLIRTRSEEPGFGGAPPDLGDKFTSARSNPLCRTCRRT